VQLPPLSPLLSAVDETPVLNKATSQGISSVPRERVASATSLVWFLLTRCQGYRPRRQGPPMTAKISKGGVSGEPVVQLVSVHRLLGQRMVYLVPRVELVDRLCGLCFATGRPEWWDRIPGV